MALMFTNLAQSCHHKYIKQDIFNMVEEQTAQCLEVLALLALEIWALWYGWHGSSASNDSCVRVACLHHQDGSVS